MSTRLLKPLSWGRNHCSLFTIWMYWSFAGAEPTTPGGRPSSSLRWVYSDRMYPVMKSLFKMGLIMFYFYLCDRSVSQRGILLTLSFFAKQLGDENKENHHKWWPCQTPNTNLINIRVQINWCTSLTVLLTRWSLKIHILHYTSVIWIFSFFLKKLHLPNWWTKSTS